MEVFLCWRNFKLYLPFPVCTLHYHVISVSNRYGEIEYICRLLLNLDTVPYRNSASQLEYGKKVYKNLVVPILEKSGINRC